MYSDVLYAKPTKRFVDGYRERESNVTSTTTEEEQPYVHSALLYTVHR